MLLDPEFEVLRTVVITDTVFVVDLLTFDQRAPQHLFHDDTMLEIGPAPRNILPNISTSAMRCDPATPVAVTFSRATALRIAEIVGTAEGATLLPITSPTRSKWRFTPCAGTITETITSTSDTPTCRRAKLLWVTFNKNLSALLTRSFWDTVAIPALRILIPPLACFVLCVITHAPQYTPFTPA